MGDSKPGSIEDAILGVWEEAAQEVDEKLTMRQRNIRDLGRQKTATTGKTLSKSALGSNPQTNPADKPKKDRIIKTVDKYGDDTRLTKDTKRKARVHRSDDKPYMPTSSAGTHDDARGVKKGDPDHKPKSQDKLAHGSVQQRLKNKRAQQARDNAPRSAGAGGKGMYTQSYDPTEKLAASFSPEEIENFDMIMNEKVSTPEVEAVWKTAAEENMSGEQSYEMGTDRYRKHTQDITPGQQVEESFQTLTEATDWLFEEIVDMSDEDFDALLEESSELELEGILGSIGRGIKKAVTYGTDKSKLDRANKRGAKLDKKLADKQALKKSRDDNIAKQANLKKFKQDNPGRIRRVAKKVGALGRAGVEKIKKSMEEVELEDVQKESTTNLRDTIVNMWAEASSAVNPNDREELDTEVDGKGGSETAKRMKHADEPKPGIKSEALDKVDKKALKKDFDDREDGDIDNDGDEDDSDEFLHKKRKAISKAIDAKEDLTFAQAQDFKVDSMRQALAKVWGLDEWKNTKENRRVDGGDKRRSENKIGDKLKKLGRDVKQQWKDDLKDFNPSRKHKDPIKPMESAKKSGKTDTGGKMAEVEIDPELKDKK